MSVDPKVDLVVIIRDPLDIEKIRRLSRGDNLQIGDELYDVRTPSTLDEDLSASYDISWKGDELILRNTLLYSYGAVSVRRVLREIEQLFEWMENHKISEYEWFLCPMIS